MKRRPGPRPKPDFSSMDFGTPHCDSRVFHAPGRCVYCDGHPEWQRARFLWGINFTGENDPDKLPCPADVARPQASPSDHRQWGGNVATTPGTSVRSYEDELDDRLRQIAEERAPQS